MSKIKREISPEIKAKLMGHVPISKDVGAPFTPPIFDDIPEDLRPVYYQRGWTVKEKASMTTVAESEEKAMELVRITIVGGENLIDFGSCEDIDFKADPDGGMAKEIFDTYPTKASTAFMNNAMKLSGLTSEEKEDLG